MTTRRSATARDWCTLPNAITLVRLLLTLPICVLIVFGTRPVLTLVLVVVFGASDWVDGYLARKLGQTSRFGAVFDPVADRLGVVLVVLALTVAGLLPWWIPALIAATDLALGIFALALKRTAELAVNRLGKIRTAVLMVGLVLVLIGAVPGAEIVALPALWLTATGAALHAVAGIEYGRSLVTDA